PGGFPTMAIANNDFINGTGALDNQLSVKWWTQVPIPGTFDNPQYLVLADLLGQGRPQVISHSDRRSIGIQDIKDGRWLLYTQVYGSGYMHSNPIPVDVDADGRGDVIISYGLVGPAGKPEH